MNEETRVIERVGNYSTTQVDVKDCKRCHNAKYATVIIDGLCLDCYSQKVVESNEINSMIKRCQESLSPDGYERFTRVIEELMENRHIPSYLIKEENNNEDKQT